MKLFAAILLAVVVAACGGKSSPATTTTTTEGHDHAGHEGHEGHEEHLEHPELTPEMTAFHDVLAPLWHAEAGPQRMADTCAAVDNMRGLGEQVIAHPPATVDETAWVNEGSFLQNTLNELEASCANNGEPDEGVLTFDAAFERVHEAFHAIMGLLPKA
jgi:hypothetical protein